MIEDDYPRSKRAERRAAVASSANAAALRAWLEPQFGAGTVDLVVDDFCNVLAARKWRDFDISLPAECELGVFESFYTDARSNPVNVVRADPRERYVKVRIKTPCGPWLAILPFLTLEKA